MTDVRLDYGELRQFIEDIFAAAGFRREEARVEADVLIWADLRGLRDGLKFPHPSLDQ